MPRYYEGGVSSVYMWDLDPGFAACVLFKKLGEKAKRNPIEGSWDSIHVIEVEELSGGKKANYKLTSTIMLTIKTNDKKVGSVNLSGSLTRQMRQEYRVDKNNPHSVNMGKMIEHLENRLRDYIKEIYFGRTRQIIDLLHSQSQLSESKRRDAVKRGLAKNFVEAPGTKVSR